MRLPRWLIQLFAGRSELEPKELIHGIWHLPRAEEQERELRQNAVPEWHLPKGCTATGELAVPGSAIIDGHYYGNIAGNGNIIIGKSAIINGSINAVSIVVQGTVRGDITGSECIEICTSAIVFGNVVAPQIIGRKTERREFVSVIARGRPWQVATFVMVVATVLIGYLHGWRDRIQDESDRVATRRAKTAPDAPPALSLLTRGHFEHSESSGPATLEITPKSRAAASSASPGAVSTAGPRMPPMEALSARGEAKHGSAGARMPAAPSGTSDVQVVSPGTVIKLPLRVPAGMAPGPVENAQKAKNSVPSSARFSSHIELDPSIPVFGSYTSSPPAKPGIPQTAHTKIPSSFEKNSLATPPAVAVLSGGRTSEEHSSMLRRRSAPRASQAIANKSRVNEISANNAKAKTATRSELTHIDGTLQKTEDAVPAGTKITISNWKQYKAFMPEGMNALFSGKYDFKMPNDVEINVGPPIHIVAPFTFRQASEKYGGDVRVIHLPNGHNDVANYVAGEPFPVPQVPDKGYEILANLWYAYSPHLAVGMSGTGAPWKVTMLDRFGNTTTATWAFVYRQLAFNTDPGVPRTDSRSAGAFYTQWLMTDEPEQAKYTTDLDILPQDPKQSELNYIFIPAFRRSVSLSVSARCAPLLGTDWTHDDQKPGFNGGLSIFDADYIKSMKMLALVDLTEAVSDFPHEYDMPLGFARPSWGSWSIRDVWVINIHRIPSEASGYCYAKRIEYVDKETARSLWEDLYDSRSRLWKVTMSAYHPREVPGADGETIYGRFAAATWDLQNKHATFGNSTDPKGRLIMFNNEVPREFDDVTQYSSPSGLMQIMR